MRRVVESVGGLAALLLIGAAAVLATAGDAPGRPSAAGPSAVGAVTGAVAPDQDPVAAGQQLYLQSCASCHGPTGEGAAGPPLTGSGAAAWDFYLRTGRMPLSAPNQPAYRQEVSLSDEEIQSLVAYGRTIAAGPDIPRLVDRVTLQRGWQLYTQNCAACHGPAGAGGAIGGGSLAPGLGRADAQLVAEAMVVGPGVMPVFPMPPEDLTAIGRYVEYLHGRPSPGGIDLAGTGPVPEGFVAGVLGLGLLLLVARWVGRSRTP